VISIPNGLRVLVATRPVTRLSAYGPTAEAIGYALNHWDGLVWFLEDGRIDLGTNPVERAIRPVALSRKTRCSPAPMKVGRTGQQPRPSSRPASSTA